MSDWEFQTSDALTAQQWARKFWIEAKTLSFFYDRGLVGSSPDGNCIVEMADLEKQPGYQVTFGQIRELSGAGVSGDNAMEGNEEAPSVYDDAITLGQKRNAIRTKGRLSDQYSSDTGLRMWAKALLKRWMAATIDQDLFTAIETSPTKALYGGDATATNTIEAGDYFELALIDNAVAYAEKATPEIVPIQKGADGMFVCIVAPDQKADMRKYDGTYQQAVREAEKRGKDNPLFKGGPAFWNNTVIHSHKRVALATAWGSGANLNGAAALFMGSQTAAIAYAKRRTWNEKTFDYKNKVGFCIGAIFGVTKAVFNSADNALVAIRTYRSSN